ncbi:unnamed protein product [Cuscuta campestris]|uniref:NAB domain-containing protein n=1 Tax=Cuscuta campestris TaxID=132261 RepID=A0A484KNZ4_9ASTE|nr:unnamed protein product [Cuscuta campestris]
MASMLRSESRRLYSWWWDSHIPKNSKWLQENLTDMDAKIKAMIKLIEEDADSFARRAEMYYKKRPELIKLVEEFYRAYRALAERYDYVTGELRHAHKAMAEVIPNQMPFLMVDDSPSSASTLEADPHTPEILPPARALPETDDDLQKNLSSWKHDFRMVGIYPGELDAESSEKGLKQLNEIIGGQNGASKISKFLDGGLVRGLPDIAEFEVQSLKEALTDIEAEKESLLLQYKQCLEKLSAAESKLVEAQKDSVTLIEQASNAGTELQALKESLSKVKAERDSELEKSKQYLLTISSLEGKVSQVQENVKDQSDRAFEAESEAQSLRNEISKLESENEACLCHENGPNNPLEDSSEKLIPSQSATTIKGVMDLQQLGTRIKAVEKVVGEQMKKPGMKTKTVHNTMRSEIEALLSQHSMDREIYKLRDREGSRDEYSDNVKLTKRKPKPFEVKHGSTTKDIPLDHGSDCSPQKNRRRGATASSYRIDDQMLELWETAAGCSPIRTVRGLKTHQQGHEQPREGNAIYNHLSAEWKNKHPPTDMEVKELGVDKLELPMTVSQPDQGTNDRRILERLTSDAEKLTGIQVTVDNMRRRLETTKRSRKSKNVDYDTVKEQLQEVEESVVQLVNLNSQLVENANEGSFGDAKEVSNVWHKRVTEQAKKGSEKIGRLQMEVQKIQYVLLKLEEEKKGKARSRFSKRKTGIVLKDFIYIGRRDSEKRKKEAHLCGCFRPSSRSGSVSHI